MTAAIYCRLSREDEEKQSESESIQNQKSMLIKYALTRAGTFTIFIVMKITPALTGSARPFDSLSRMQRRGGSTLCW